MRPSWPHWLQATLLLVGGCVVAGSALMLSVNDSGVGSTTLAGGVDLLARTGPVGRGDPGVPSPSSHRFRVAPFRGRQLGGVLRRYLRGGRSRPWLAAGRLRSLAGEHLTGPRLHARFRAALPPVPHRCPAGPTGTMDGLGDGAGGGRLDRRAGSWSRSPPRLPGGRQPSEHQPWSVLPKSSSRRLPS